MVYPEDRDLFIDIDDDASLNTYLEMGRVLHENGFYFTETKRTRSAGGNTHIYAKFTKQLTDLERVLLQACLGSDRKRELLSFLRIVLRLDRAPTVFFETPDDGTQ